MVNNAIRCCGCYIKHTDHLGTSQVITDANQFTVWSADYEPFGQATITMGAITNNLRFPGQYFDEETGLHYNYFRDYDPSTGRYIESDPVGLLGGLNTYSYALQNPVVYYDPSGHAVPILLFGCAAGAIGPILLGNSFSNIALACSLGAISTVGAAATATATAVRILGGLTAAAVGGLGAVGDAQGSEPGDPNPSLPGLGSPGSVSEDIQRKFCELNPTAPNCQSDPEDCE